MILLHCTSECLIDCSAITFSWKGKFKFTIPQQEGNQIKHEANSEIKAAQEVQTEIRKLIHLKRVEKSSTITSLMIPWLCPDSLINIISN